MNTLEAMQARHSVRQYLDKPIPANLVETLRKDIAACNEKSGLHIQLVTDEPKAFDSTLAHYGKFEGVKNYLAMIGPKNADTEEEVGYYGEKLVLDAQKMGLNTCWVGLTFKKIPSVLQIGKGDKLWAVIALGYGITQGVSHKSKTFEEVTQNLPDQVPDWFKKGVDAALLAPTAVNQQKFKFSLKGNQVSIKPGFGFFTRMDQGIVRYHFEQGAGFRNFSWMKS